MELDFVKNASVKLFHNKCNSSQSILAIIVLLGQSYLINWYFIPGFHMIRFCLNDFPEKLFRLVGIWEMTFCWVDSVEIAFPTNYFV